MAKQEMTCEEFRVFAKQDPDTDEKKSKIVRHINDCPDCLQWLEVLAKREVEIRKAGWKVYTYTYSIPRHPNCRCSWEPFPTLGARVL